MFTPTEAKSPEEQLTFRIGIQGFPKTGKSWAALTFPNPIVLNIDNNIPKLHPNLSSVLQIPFYDPKFCTELGCGAKHPSQPPVRHLALTKWLRANAQKFESDQTLILDSLTFLGNYFDLHWDLNPQFSNKGKENDFVPWQKKVLYFTDLHELVKSLRCNFIAIVHETEAFDDEGRIIGLKPLITGSFSNQLAGHYTEWFRQRVISEKDKPPRYVWQIVSDSVSKNGGTLSSIVKDKPFIDANYQTLVSIIKEEQNKQQNNER